ncbi:MAG: hypothetical protein JWQ27_342 [Ferruginibacter sp.]|nr:hypothetical protein [Ferruginibacter sp.]
MRVLLVLALLVTMSCSKSSDPLDNFANNDVQINVLSSTGVNTAFSFHGVNAPMYMSSGIYGVSRFQCECKISSNDRKFIFAVNQNDPTNTVVSCLYYPGGSNPNSYSTDQTSNPATIHFTSFSNHYAEGNFIARCKQLNDSVLVTGTFKGYYNE